jgi:hypothetical protein
MKIGSGIQTLMGRGIHRHHDDLISLLLHFSKQRRYAENEGKESTVRKDR